MNLLTHCTYMRAHTSASINNVTTWTSLHFHPIYLHSKQLFQPPTLSSMPSSVSHSKDLPGHRSMWCPTGFRHQANRSCWWIYRADEMSREDGLTVIHPEVLVSLTSPKEGAREFRGRHFLSRRFVPR
ncbi:hypothetical protein EDC04DRAFT_682334 [Pisolithus marmoratus]|nr:hypothetical protein EDC04DRAFT_682334 [Pisolithus marmoratus]